MKIISHPAYVADLNAIARTMAAFVADLHAKASGEFDVKKAARLLLLSNVDAFNSLNSGDGDELLGELLEHARRVRVQRKGGAA